MVLTLDVKFVFFSMWEYILNLTLPLSLIKNQFRGLVIENLNFLDFLREVGLSNFFFGFFYFI